MQKFTCHVIMKRGLETIEFAPGDELPSWAIGQVGAHVLTPGGTTPEAEPRNPEADASDEDANSESGSGSDADPSTSEIDADADADKAAAGTGTGTGTEQDAADAAPDFTKPAPVKRGRPRKQD